MAGGLREHVGGPDFERGARASWEREYDGHEGGEEDVERHAERVGGWLVHRGFVPRRPLRLLPDPKGQDQWTTCVEYFAFEAEALYALAEAARRLEGRVKRGRGYEGKYRAAEAAVDQQRCRVDWVLAEIESIEAGEKAAAAAAGESGGGDGGRSGKRRRMDETSGSLEDVVEPRLGKRRRMVKVEETEKTHDMEETPAGKSDSLSQTRRSKRCKPSTGADVKEEEEDVPEPRSKRTKVASSTSDGPNNSNNNNNSSSIPQPQASDPEAPAVSAVTTSKTTPSRRRQSERMKTSRATVAAPPDPREGRLKSLRPRVDGKVVTGSTDLRRHKGGRRSRGRLPRVAAAVRGIS